MDQAREKDDARTVEREAHSLKGAVSILGAKKITDLALELELSGRAGDLTDAKKKIDKLRTEFEHLKEYINKLLSRNIAVE